MAAIGDADGIVNARSGSEVLWTTDVVVAAGGDSNCPGANSNSSTAGSEPNIVLMSLGSARNFELLGAPGLGAKPKFGHGPCLNDDAGLAAQFVLHSVEHLLTLHCSCTRLVT